ncbi:autotransporter outer membrane beta-barrel domain-containing protein [Helicobacter cholecystus]|uniref:Autotransporter outer membrane beta-barrel domain-containing protein n=1 Tax=Helicobacter cholecystus TaxID=45498 RepID=A0A3D8IYJ1_9HELI|nr:autotransporter outer membrane beta-barrel domain-containing protein [Helicobacter cholecystus]RDU70056.1 autotransporter outer membrane beta-barrel domain-containing protein [Helicobacter cholecystus]VEJ24773.1 hypothetical glycine-rich autotransporter protein [Helicobacter cholecystus]
MKGGGQSKKSSTLLVSLALSSFLPTLAFATIQINRNQVEEIFNQSTITIDQNTTIGSFDARYNVQTNEMTTKLSKDITINNMATLEIFATNTTGYGYVFASSVNAGTQRSWTGGTIKINFLSSGWGGVDLARGGILTDVKGKFEISSNLDFTYREDDDQATWRTLGVSAIGSHDSGVVKLLGNYIKINTIGHPIHNQQRGIIALMASQNGSIYLNANDDGTIKNKDAIIQIKGSISTGLKSLNTEEGSGKIYAHFSGKDSYLMGNVYAGLYGGESQTNLSFSNNAHMIGDIYALDNKTHDITFDNANLTGKASYSSNSGATTTLTFKNNAQWLITENSRVTNLSLTNNGNTLNLDLYSAPRVQNSSTVTRGTSNPNNNLRTLEIKNLKGDEGRVLLGIDGNKSDRLEIGTLETTNLYISVKDVNLTPRNFDSNPEAIVLVSADSVNNGVVRGSIRKEGLSYVTTTLEHQVSENPSTLTPSSTTPQSRTANNTQTTAEIWSKAEDEGSANYANKKHRWVLSGLSSEINEELVNESGFLISNPYRMLMIESNNLNKRMGDLRGIPYNQGAWLRIFNGSDSGEGVKNLYTNIQLGYDYGIGVIGAKNYSGVAFSTSMVNISANQYNGKANTYSLAAYHAYIADSGLYVDTIAKYLYIDQKLDLNTDSRSNFGNHALSLGAEVGYRAYMGKSNFYFEPQVELIGGLILGVKDINLGIIHGQSVKGELKMTTALNARVGVVQGYSLKTQNGLRADFRLGANLVNETVSDNTPIRLYDGITEAQRNIGNNIKAVFNVGTNLVLTEQWRMYIDAERSFGGRNRNTDYQANIGARFSFGDKITSLPKPQKILPQKLENNQ